MDNMTTRCQCSFWGQFKWEPLHIIYQIFNDIIQLIVYVYVLCICIIKMECMIANVLLRADKTVLWYFYEMMYPFHLFFVLIFFFFSSFSLLLFQFPFPFQSFVRLIFIPFIQKTKFIFVNTPWIFCYALCITRDKLLHITDVFIKERKKRKINHHQMLWRQ